MAGVTKSELVCRLAYACQRGITLQKSDVDMNDVFDDFDDREDQIMLQAGPIFSFFCSFISGDVFVAMKE